MVICKECKKSFDKFIPWQHLQCHGMTTIDYREKYGQEMLLDLVYRQELVNKNRDKMIALNKDKEFQEKAWLGRRRLDQSQIVRNSWQKLTKEERKIRTASLRSQRSQEVAYRKKIDFWRKLSGSERQEKNRVSTVFQRSVEAREKARERAIEWLRNPSFSDGGYRQVFYVAKDGQQVIFCRSSYELQACKIFDSDPTIISWQSAETIRIPYELDGILRVYLPDFLVRFKNGEVRLIEVKSVGLIKNRKVVVKALAAEQFCFKQGWEYQIWTEKELCLRVA